MYGARVLTVVMAGIALPLASCPRAGSLYRPALWMTQSIGLGLFGSTGADTGADADDPDA